MEEKKFLKIVYTIILIGIIITSIMIKYTLDQYKKLSITSFISTEEVIDE